jgi:DNA-binding response OmpR family regulator
MDKPRILIIDDDKDIRRALHIRLRAQGYETFFAADGVSAISAAVKTSPHLILLDLGLPAGDGFVVLERLQKNTTLSCVPVIVLTALESRANKEKALSSGACAFFLKPAENGVLMTIIDKALKDTGALAR